MLKKIGLSAVVCLLVALTGCGSSGQAGPDLNKVLDVFADSLDNFVSAEQVDQSSKEANDAVMKEFAEYTERKMNSPRIADYQLGLELQTDGSFVGYHDASEDYVKDSGEKQMFTVEIDTERNRLIATDTSGNSTGMRFSAAGFLAGMIIGNLLSRQARAGISKSSFANRKVMSSQQYSSARSKSFSGSHSSGK